MTQFRQANGRHVEQEFRSKGPPRIPRIAAPVERTQWVRTVLACVLIALAVIAYLIN